MERALTLAQEQGQFITVQFLRILSDEVWSDEERRAFARLEAGGTSQRDLAIRPRLMKKTDALILYQTENGLGLAILNSAFVLGWVNQWETNERPDGAALLAEWGKRLGVNTLIHHGKKRVRIENNPAEYSGKRKTVDQLKSLAAMLRADDLIGGLGREERLTAVESVIRKHGDKFDLLADAENLSRWMAFFQSGNSSGIKTALDRLLDPRPPIATLYNEWRSSFTPGISPEKMQSLISLSAPRP
jgi:hypothetical protein